ncbi:hypothetical protein ACHAW5_000570 [Stephanodiscus triporus]|uniref:ATPase F1/V1/A1 complex alpha/beta subunit nucleotide-binding domain-containing protein n=1 Tax=Stephanodiscus triporus TaxID=2934178 RepID=A0ABD3QH55_9STRA
METACFSAATSRSRAPQRTALPQPRERPHHRAHHHAAIGPDDGRVPRVREGSARARDTDGHELLRRLREGPRGEEVPEGGYPGYMYTDLPPSTRGQDASLAGTDPSPRSPSTMPNDDITHPIPDLTGYITEDDLLDRQLHTKNIFPPINVLPSLSRLMKSAIGEGMTQTITLGLQSAVRVVRDGEGRHGHEGRERRRCRWRITSTSPSSSGSSRSSFRRPRTRPGPLRVVDLAWSILRAFPKELLKKIPRKDLDKYYARSLAKEELNKADGSR